MKQLFGLLVFMMVLGSNAQQDPKKIAQQKADADNLVYQGNQHLEEDSDFIAAEMEYRKALSTQSSNVAGAYNLGHIYYNNESFSEALYRHQEAAKLATSKDEKHRAFHNIGNILMKNEKCKEAVEAFKNALRNNPSDDETRYNLALAKDCANKQEDGGGENDKEDENQDNKEDQKDENKEKDQEQKQDQDDKGDQDQKKGEEEEDENGKPKNEKNDKGDGENNKKPQQNKPQPGQLSPQQIKNLLEAMNNQEQKVQEKMNAKKQKGAKVKTEKDW